MESTLGGNSHMERGFQKGLLNAILRSVKHDSMAVAVSVSIYIYYLSIWFVC